MKELQYERQKSDQEEDSKKRKVRSVGSETVPTVRTFRADVEEMIQEKKMTKTQIAMAEANRREARGLPRTLPERDDSHLGRIIFILVLVLAFGIGVGMYALIGTNVALPFFKEATSTPPIATTKELGIVLTDSPKEQILADISIAFGKTSLPLGEKRPLVFLMREATGETRQANVTEFFGSLFAIKPIADLLRSLDADFTYEIRSNRTLSGAITIPSRSYANSFTAMLRFEDTMAVDLLPVLNPWYDRPRIKDLEKIPFTDERIGTTDVRVLSDATGVTVIVYGFPDKKTLIIAGSKDAFMTTVADRKKEQ